MNNKLLTSLVTVSVLGLTSANAAIIAAEFFNDYGAGTATSNDTSLLNGGTGWTNGWNEGNGTDDPDVEYTQGAGLTYGSIYDNSGNQTGLDDGAFVYAGANAGQSVLRRDLTTAATTIWFSALISIDEVDDRAVLWLDYTTPAGDGPSNDFVGVLDGNIQMRYNNTNVTSAGAPTTGTHLLLAKVDMNVSGSNDAVSFWFNPDISLGESSLGTATYFDNSADTFGSTMDGVGVLLRDNGEIATGNEVMDAIRVGDSFSAAVPEPSTYAMIAGIGALVLVMIRRRLRSE